MSQSELATFQLGIYSDSEDTEAPLSRAAEGLHDLEKAAVELTLAHTDTLNEAAERLGITRHALRRRLQKHGITPRGKRT